MTPSEAKRLFGIDISTIHDKPDNSSAFDDNICDVTEGIECDIFQNIELIELKEPVKCVPTIPGYTPQGNVTNNITIINKASNYLLVDFSDPDNQGFINTTSYQNDILKDVDVLEYIIINNTIETKQKGDFTFNSTVGELNRSPNVFTQSDVLIINYNK